MPGLTPRGVALPARRTYELDDVQKALPSDGDALLYDASKHLYVPRALVLGDLPAISLDDLSDVTITSPAVNHVLAHTGTAWVNGLAPYIVCTSSTRPTGGEGRQIYETDTDKVFIHNGTSYVEMGRTGAYTDWTPTVTQNVARTGTVDNARWKRAGRTVSGTVKWTATEAGSASTLFFNYPGVFTPADTDFIVCGAGYINDAATDPLVIVALTSGGFQFAINGGATYSTALTVGTIVAFDFEYEAVN